MIVLTTQLSSEAGRDMYWDEHLVMVVPTVTSKEVAALAQQGKQHPLEKTFGSFDWYQFEVFDAQGNGYGWDWPKGSAAFAAHMAAHGFPGVVIQPAKFVFVRE